MSAIAKGGHQALSLLPEGVEPNTAVKLGRFQMVWVSVRSISFPAWQCLHVQPTHTMHTMHTMQSSINDNQKFFSFF